MIKVKKEGQGVLFSNSFLELLTKTNPVIHVITYGGAVAFFFYLNRLSLYSTFMYLLAGGIIWTLVEYLIHRFLFHIRESRFQYMIHGVHHEYPRDKERLMMPPVPGVIIVSLFFGLWHLVLHENAPAFMAGFVMTYMLYTFIHYMVHAWKPIPGFKFLWSHHLKHHNPVYEHKAFGVTTRLWDFVFGTMPDKKEVKHSDRTEISMVTDES